ncbi:DotH/IcmK family type IV secretion protein [Morganella psychrotolerans]|uniref:DotH/IcmK family type IV secretion protein n=1 Tax=Morganella psychrotolerans TaxID=368603 RepID=UPI0039B05956
MKKTLLFQFSIMFVISVWIPVMAANSENIPVAADVGFSGNAALPVPSQSLSYQQAEESIAPLTPDEIRKLRAENESVERALTTPQVAVVPKISVLNVDLSPGGSLPLARTAVNYPSSITFMDNTGSGWNIAAPPISGNPAFKVHWVENTPVMVIEALRPYADGNIIVYLSELSVPVILNINSGEADSEKKAWIVDSRLDLRIPRRGPGSPDIVLRDTRIGLHDSTLQSFLDGIPPKEAKRLKINGDIPDTTVWQIGDSLYVRSRADIRDEFEATLSSSDGMHLWKLPLTPYLSFSVIGQNRSLNISLE